MSLFSTLKRNSKLAMRGNYGRAVLILLLLIGVGVMLCSFLTIATYAVNGGTPPSNPTMEHQDMLRENAMFLNAVMIAATLFGLFLITPLMLGVVGWYLSVVKGSPEPFGSVFSFFERAGRYFCAVWYSVNMTIRTMFWALVFFALPTIAMIGGNMFDNLYAAGGNRQFAILSALGIALGSFLTLLATLLYSAYMNKYFLTAYLLANDESLTVTQAIRLSVKLTRGHRFSILWYMLSFAGWVVLSILPGVIFFTKPYMHTSFAMYAYYLTERTREPEALCATQEFSQSAAVPPPRETAEQSTIKLEWQDVPQEIPQEAPQEIPQEISDETVTEKDPDKWPYI